LVLPFLQLLQWIQQFSTLLSYRQKSIRPSVYIGIYPLAGGYWLMGEKYHNWEEKNIKCERKEGNTKDKWKK
jgi:hypothetical protein